MGARLKRLFDFAQETGGEQTVMRLTMKTGISEDNAASTADDDDTISQVSDAIAAITGDTPPSV